MMTAEDVRSYLNLSAMEWQAHSKKHGVTAPGVIEQGRLLVDIMPAKLGVEIQMWWDGVKSVLGDRLLWDCARSTATLEEANEIVESICPPGQKVSGLATRAMWPDSERAMTLCPMFEFHPQRYARLRIVGNAMMQFGRRSEDFGMNQGFVDTLGRAANEEIRTGNKSARVRWLNKKPDDMSGMQIHWLAFANAAFNRYGKAIFQFPKTLLQMFGRTDVDDIPVDLLKLPYQGLYLHFGRQERLVDPYGWAPDGAYVFHGGRQMLFVLTFAPESVEQYLRDQESQEPCYEVLLEADELKMGIGEAVDAAVSRTLNELVGQIQGKDTSHMRALGVSLDAGGNLSHVEQTTDLAAAEIERLRVVHEKWREMLKLVVNGLAYLSAYPDDSVQAWPRQTPKAMTEKMAAGGPGARKIPSKLAALGYTPVWLCGQSFEREAPNADGNDRHQASESRRQTWVRGFWIRQVHGPQRSLRKLMWRMPVLRNKSDGTAPGGDDDAVGHVYLVS